MRGYFLDNNVSGYRQIVRDLIAEGHPTGSRVGGTLEFEDVSIVMEHPSRSMCLDRPGYQPLLGLVEGAQLVAGVLDQDAIKVAAPNYATFSDFWGAYGPRIADQLPLLVKELTDSPESRRGVIAMWMPEKDAAGGHTDHPCTLSLTFRIRGGMLNMTAHMRSNDVWFGWPYDAVQFSLLQMTLANVLDVEVGTYVHHADSFHLYSKNLSAAKTFIRDREHSPESIQVSYERGWAISGFGYRGCTLAEAQGEALTAMRGEYAFEPNSDPTMLFGETDLSGEHSKSAVMLNQLMKGARDERSGVDAENAAIARASEA